MNIHESKLTVLETEEKLEIIIPPAKFTNHLTIVFILIYSIVSLFVAVGAYAAFYANIAFKLAMLIVFIFWLWNIKLVVIEFFGEMFINTTKIDVSTEKIDVSRSRERGSNNYLSLPVSEIASLRLLIRHTDSIDIHPQLFFKTKDTEYSIQRFTAYNFTNAEITLMAEKISNYIKKDVIK